MSQAVCIGDIAFLAGQVPDDLSADIEEQTRQVLIKMDAVVTALGATKSISPQFKSGWRIWQTFRE